MKPALGWLAGGAVLGWFATIIVLAALNERPGTAAAAAGRVPESTASSPNQAQSAADPAPVPGENAAMTAAAHAAAAALTDLSDIERRFDQALADPASPESALTVAALLLRLAAFDPELALNRLPAIDAAQIRRSAALAMLRLVGNGQPGIERVASVLAATERPGFRIDALGQLAAADPARALELADALPTRMTRRLAVERIAAAGMARDPVAAWALAESIADQSLRSAYRASAVAAWAAVDPQAAIAFLPTVDATGLSTTEGFDALRLLADAAPAELLSAAGRFPAAIGGAVRSMALGAVAEQDVPAALAMAESMPPGNDRETLLSTVAADVARRDPAQALEWALALDPPSRRAALSALAGIAETDFDRAVEIVLEQPEILGYPTVALLPIEVYPERIPRIADRLALAGDEFASSLGTLLGSWARTDPERTANWMLLNGSRVDATTFRSVAQTMAQENAAVAAAFAERMPQDLRASWIAGIAVNYALQTPDAAARLIATMPEGALRDGAIGSTLGPLLGMGEFLEPSLLDAFSSHSARDAAIRGTLPYIRSGNVELAARLEAYIADPAFRAEFGDRLERTRD